MSKTTNGTRYANPATLVPQVPVPAPVPSLSAPANPQAVTPVATVPQSLFVYPREGQQTQDQITADRSDCNEWAIGQTGYGPVHPGTAGSQRVGDFQRAVRTCLAGKGYTVN